jgi:hypothetical protein
MRPSQWRRCEHLAIDAVLDSDGRILAGLILMFLGTCQPGLRGLKWVCLGPAGVRGITSGPPRPSTIRAVRSSAYTASRRE